MQPFLGERLQQKAKQALTVLVLFLFLMLPVQRTQADEMREFLMSCTYGVLAGTLVGAAMLAFTDKPGDNLNKIARGASLGLYFGIGLGLYLVYGIPDEEEDPEGYIEEDGYPGDVPPEGAEGVEGTFIRPMFENKVVYRRLPKLLVYPLLDEHNTKIEGVAAKLRVVEF